MPTKSVYIGDLPKIALVASGKYPEEQLSFQLNDVRGERELRRFEPYTTSYDEWFGFNAAYELRENEENLCYLFKEKQSYATAPMVIMPDGTKLCMRMRKFHVLQEVMEHVASADVVMTVFKYTPLLFDLSVEMKPNEWPPVFRGEWYMVRSAKKEKVENE